MRRGKWYAVHAGLRLAEVELSQARVFDFGFGAGSFLFSCPLDCHLAGSELDAVHVGAVATKLHERGQRGVDLRAVQEGLGDLSGAFFHERYDVIVLSHVLEHVPDPPLILSAARAALSRGGVVIVVLPLNEITPDPHHCHDVNVPMAKDWCVSAGLKVSHCVELGRVNYLLQPHLKGTTKVGRFVAQSLSLGVGMLTIPFSPTAWWRVTDRMLPGVEHGQLLLVGRPVLEGSRPSDS